MDKFSDIPDYTSSSKNLIITDQYNYRFNQLVNEFKQKLGSGINKNGYINIRVDEFGHDIDRDDDFDILTAIGDFGKLLSMKNYPYTVTSGSEKVSDFERGQCTVGYKMFDIKIL